MNRNIKLTTLTAILLFTIIISIFYGCSGNQDNTSVENTLISDNFDFIGKDHNLGLDFVYDKIKESLDNQSDTTLKSAIDVHQIAEDATKEFMQRYKMSEEQKAFACDQIKREFSSRNTKNGSTSNQLYNEEIEEQLTQDAKQLFASLDTLIRNFRPDKLDETQKEIKRLEDMGKLSLLDKELAVFFSASSVAKHTTVYWSENAKKWRELLNKNVVETTNKLKTNKSYSPQRLLRNGNKKYIGGHISANEMPMGLAGANIIIQGTCTGTCSNYDGYYSLEASEGDILKCLYIGFTPQTKVVGQSSIVNFTLCDEFSFGEVARADVNGAVVAAGACWAVNTIPGAGQAGYGGFIVTGALSGSGSAIIDQF